MIGAGGFLGVGDTHFAYPWNKAKCSGSESITVELDDDKIDDYSLFKDIEGRDLKGTNWRVTELLDGYAYLKGGVPYGLVDDVVFNRKAEIKAVVVYPDVRYRQPGPYAWPYYGCSHGFDLARDYYEIPHDEKDVKQLKVFVYPTTEEKT